MPHGVAPARWRDLMVRQLKRLGHRVEGRLVVEPDPVRKFIPAERFLEADYLHAVIVHDPSGGADSPAPAMRKTAIDDDAKHGGEKSRDARILASRFTRQYTSGLSAVALTGLAHGVGIDVSSRRCTMIIDHDARMFAMIDVPDREVLRCAERPTTWPVGGPVVDSLDELREYVWRRLYSEHIESVFARILEMVNVAPRLLWANAAEWVGMVSDAAEDYLAEPDADPFIADRKALLGAESLPGQAGPNPLHGQLDWVPADGDEYPSKVQTRRFCCLVYMLPDRHGRLCDNCPFLPLEDRTALIRERLGSPSGNATGPAQQRAIDVGLAKLEHVRRSPMATNSD
jgi:hypothetical protein